MERLWHKEIAKVRAENKRLRKALVKIRDHRARFPGDAEQDMINMADIAILGGDPTP